ncbi:MAG: efflux RND transporter permease subunit [Bacteroidia bacterium]|nr:efflux RND transporter permease subunit [Bacteroidia bacterium]
MSNNQTQQSPRPGLEKFKEFFMSSWAIDNRITIFIISIILVLAGFGSYISLPKENFPEISIPTIYVGTVYPGTSPEDIENLVTRKIEKEMKSIDGVKEIKSNSVQDFSVVIVEFETTKDLKEAKREVQEAVDKAKSELPNDLPNDPNVQDINLSEIPIMFVNLYGDLDLVTIKKYAEDLQDEIEALKEITRVDLVGALDREIQVNVDLYKMEAAGVGFGDIERAVASENVIISGGQIDMDGMKRALRVSGEYESVQEIADIVVSGVHGNKIYLKDIANVVDGFKDRESYARLNGFPVITLNVIKKAGQNLVDAADKIKNIVEENKAEKFPSGLEVNISGDQSNLTNNMLSDLTNTIILGFILVTLVLMFFMGLRDSMFVGLSVPLAAMIAFIVLPSLGFTLNLVVLFSFIFALGIVVDNAIVVIENTHRILNKERLPIVLAAKKGAGEVIGPVFAGTLTTMAPFLPLMAWEGVIGEFMFFLPVTILITLTASLLVAYVINPVFAVAFMTPDSEKKVTSLKNMAIRVGILVAIMVPSYLLGARTLGNVILIFTIILVMQRFLFDPTINFFQKKMLPWMMDLYRKILIWALKGATPYVISIGTMLLFLVSVVALAISKPEVVQFPSAEPNFVYVYNTLPIGTDIAVTDSITREIEKRVLHVLGENNPVVASVISNVAVGAGDRNDFSRNAMPHKSKVSVEFVQFKYRNGVSTLEILDKIREEVKGIPGALITAEKEANGPPQPKPINLQITAESFEVLVETATDIRQYLEDLDIEGVDELKWDLELAKPEVVIDVDRAKASELGISTAQIGMAIRTSVFGKEVSKYRENEDEYPIQVRLDKKFRNDVNSLLNQRLIYRNMANGKIYEVPISAVASIRYDKTFGGINRLDLKKSVTLFSNVLTGYDANTVVNQVKAGVEEYVRVKGLPKGVELDSAGEMEEQKETGLFMVKALMISFLLIFVILVTQFNSLPKVFIILTQIVFSMTGVFFGFAISHMVFAIPMVGVGIVSLAGIVVNNGIILLDFIGLLKERGHRTKYAIIEGGVTRFTPVVLTASSTVLGLIPLAIALNINFASLFTSLDPQIFTGGDNSVFWGPLSWTVIYGLTFATIVTLVVVPAMYYISYVNILWMQRKWNKIKRSSLFQ